MVANPLVPALDTAPPAVAEQREPIARLLEGLDAKGLWWLSGYAAGLATTRGSEPAPTMGLRPVGSSILSIVYGSQTGNARRVAEALRDRAQAEGIAVRLVRTSDYTLRDLGQDRCLLLVISTHGDGDPPDDARAFIDALNTRRAPQLAQLQYGVLGLGDSSYPKFCGVAREVDERLAALGGRRLLARGEADVEIDVIAAPWRQLALGEVKAQLGQSAPLATVTAIRPAPPAVSRDRPFAAEILDNQRITAAGAHKDVRHIELGLRGSGISWQPGDSLGVWPRNPPALVAQVIATAGLAADARVECDGRELSLGEWLRDEREITRLGRRFVAQHAAVARAADLNRLLAPGAAADLAAFLSTHQLLDLLHGWPAAWGPGELVAALRPLTPRLYSIASSHEVAGDEAHLTVAVLDYHAHGRDHVGAASRFLADAEGDDARIRVYVEPNDRFRLPADATRDVIMIGAGTGVAPFRAFVQQRAAQAASGRNWLFFGEQHFASQFLYQTEWQEALRRGQLQRLDLAFSRDQPERIYVQQRLRERADDVYSWLEGGAHLYVCGSAQGMAPDVHAALLDIVAARNGGDTSLASAFLERLVAENRYQRDIY